LNNKLLEAADKLIKDKKQGRNYGTNLVAPHVQVTAIAETDVAIKIKP
jgi:hypothetical protein